MLATASLDVSGLVMATCRHGDFAFYDSDMIGKMLLAYGEWAEQEVHFLKGFLRPGDIAVDIGAHIGTISIPMSRAVGAWGKVFSFEAQRLVYYNLCTNLMLNGIDNVHAIHAAVSDDDGFLNLRETSRSKVTNSGSFSIPEGAQSEPSEVFTRKLKLDTFLQKTPTCRLIKLDIEGHEPAALSGMASFIARSQPVIYVEANTKNRFERISKFLTESGYQSFWHFEPHFNKNNFRGNPNNRYGDKTDLNLVCFPPTWTESKPDLTLATSFEAVARFAAPA